MTEPQDLARLKGVAEKPDPVAWRYHYSVPGRPVHWTLNQRPQHSRPDDGHWAAVVAEPLYSEAAVLALIEALSKSGEREAVLREALEWQPIETAPKDGTRVGVWLVHEPDEYLDEHFERYDIAYWREANHTPGYGREADWETTWIGEPTHWRPLPAPPALSPPPVGVGG